MKKFLSIVLVMALVLCCLPAFAKTITDKMIVYNCKSWVSLRDTTNTASERLTKVPLGATVKGCKAASNGFIECTYGSKTGYILSKYLKPVTSSGTAIDDQEVANCKEWVSLRKSASTSSKRLAKVELGEVVTNCYKYGNWVKCSYDGQTGYILASYLIKEGSSKPAEPEVSDNMVVVKVNEYVSLRVSPKSSATRLVKVPLGATVTNCVLDSNGYVKCDYNGYTGYVMVKYLSTTEETGSGTSMADQKVVKVNEYVSLRESASSSSKRLAKIPLGATVTDCTLYGSFVECTYNGKTGYVLAKYLTPANP